jgi:hypothetical protein
MRFLHFAFLSVVAGFLCVIPQFVFAAAGNYTSPLSATATNGLNSIVDHQTPTYGTHDGVIKVYNGDVAMLAYGSCGSILGVPVAYYTATSAGKVCYWYDQHNGLDYNTKSMQGKDVLAAAPGIVRQVGWDTPSDHSKGFGFFVSLYHSVYGQTTLYGHTTSVPQVVHVGDNVTRSQKIAVSGSTGNSTAPHLHFSVYDGDVMATSAFPFSVDPQGWLGSGQDPWTRDNGYLFAVSPTSLSLFTTVASDITSSTTWLPGVYVINGTVNITSGARLNINRDAVIKVQTSTSKLVVADGGILDAEGTASSYIYFTSYKDDSVGGDTNGDATSSTPAAGDWNTIEFDSGASSTIAYAVVRYGGNAASSKMIYNNGGTFALATSTIATSSVWGIYTTSGTTAIVGSDIRGNQIGIAAFRGIINVSSSKIHDNSSNGFNGQGSGSITLTNNTFSNSADAAAYMYIGQGFTFTHSGNTFSGTGKNGFVMDGGTLSTDQHWTKDTMAYVIPANDFVLPAANTFTIDPGCVVKFATTSAKMTIQGTLNAQGTSSSTIYFTSITDDSVGGDTNGDGTATTPASGNWDTVQFDSTASSSLVSTILRYGGYSGLGGSSKIIYNNGGILNLSSIEVATSSNYGVYQGSGTSTIASSQIHHQSTGVYIGGGTSSASSSSFHNNTTFGVNNGTSVTLNFQHNYWGASNGPSGQGSGSGDAVSTFVDYANWLSSWP